MCCPTIKVIKNATKTILALGGLHKDNLCDILQVMSPTNVETIHQTSLFHIESNLDRLGLLSPNHDQRSQQKIGQIPLQSVLMKSQVSQGHNSLHTVLYLQLKLRKSGRWVTVFGYIYHPRRQKVKKYAESLQYFSSRSAIYS